MLLKKIILCGFLVLGLTACVEPPQSEMKVIQVTDYDFSHNDNHAVTVYFGHTGGDHYTVTLLRDEIKEGVFIESSAKNAPNLVFDASWAGEYYVQSAKHDTHSSLKILELNSEAKVAKFEVAARLVNPKQKNDYISLEKTTITVQGQQFDNLTKSF
ncbi:MAG: hypothetical protein ACJAVX_003317 [Pseudoalteromonas rhizosphaerae]|jgi:hypothetical protein|uniref:Outer membrane lipoprotein-sorting protein n=1 Tax=Pseudoalteromonas neustonica TaxID=1840331 RepID=A0ABY3FHZ8_9GAMM|nr:MULTISPECIES: outer membrane lipoprotein-sorting protein [Pseudoalteromonas]MBB1293865.1 hypothetical protein [Pseudoalteromonas sp. SR41-4]MBB1311594.1 hypothetical protein [Pseudoalteromonas sp. SR41-8]MBB1399483.1 hypothetical protein [Pseudoalteromonas sp. SG44-8]MBB1408557.1 hypothetical protein [Pseudoalteromonas sp. SG44-17]MBB1507641.1 hypothetical protein [Pseudoalteromonas sp. SG41-1]|tara:strand:+ start:4982 stop:5452 length:471 start_codon:yes stop_codon:yes gene_type:complete